MENTVENYINSAREIMGRSCVVCKKYDCEYAKSERKRIDWCEKSDKIHTDETFSCFVEK